MSISFEYSPLYAMHLYHVEHLERRSRCYSNYVITIYLKTLIKNRFIHQMTPSQYAIKENMVARVCKFTLKRIRIKVEPVKNFT